VGFALEVGDRLVINGEEVIFKEWIDQSQTAIAVQAIADVTSRTIQAREIKSLGRSIMPEVPRANMDRQVEQQESFETAYENHDDSDDNFGVDEQTPEVVEEEPVTPTYNAWEVWTYLERQRLKTLKLINTFDAEWEANRFVREAERNTPPNLRIHYEISPIWRDLDATSSEFNHDAQEYAADDHAEAPVEYVDAIDVEIID
jgi:hypothetical protein